MCSLKKLCIVSFSALSKSTLIPKTTFLGLRELNSLKQLIVLVSAWAPGTVFSFTRMSSVKRLCEVQYDNVWDVR